MSFHKEKSYSPGDFSFWAMDCIIWTTYFGLHTLDYILWTAYFGLQTMDYILWTAYYGLQTMDCKLWTTYYELNAMDCKLWTTYYELHYMNQKKFLCISLVFTTFCIRIVLIIKSTCIHLFHCKKKTWPHTLCNFVHFFFLNIETWSKKF